MVGGFPKMSSTATDSPSSMHADGQTTAAVFIPGPVEVKECSGQPGALVTRAGQHGWLSVMMCKSLAACPVWFVKVWTWLNSGGGVGVGGGVGQADPMGSSMIVQWRQTRLAGGSLMILTDTSSPGSTQAIPQSRSRVITPGDQ